MATSSRLSPHQEDEKRDDLSVEYNSDTDQEGSGTEEAQQEKPALRDRTKTKTPAYVAPIPKIGLIPPISAGVPPISAGLPTRPKLPPFVGSFLMGKTVDESGDITDDKTGQVLARAGGDLPSIVGRKVSNSQGDILGDDGELLGYVADIEIERKGSTSSTRSQPPRSLFEVMGRSNASLMVDEEGNILDAEGNVVGKFHDNNNPVHRKEREEKREREGKSQIPESERQKQSAQETPQQQQQPEAGQGQERPPRRTEDERRQNAEAWRKEKPGESPSDIFLDVKSTTEGIQLTIRIPTVFGSQQVRPNISFS